MDLVSRPGKVAPEPIGAEVTDRHHKGGVFYEIGQTHSLVRFRAKYVVGVSGETVSDTEKTFEPPSGSRSQTGKMNMNMGHPGLLKIRAEISGFPKAAFVSDVTGPCPDIFESGGD